MAWPRKALELADAPLGEFRGARETGRSHYLGWERGAPIGYIDCGTCDRWTTWEGGRGGRGVVSVIDEPSGGIAFVTDPAQRRKGHGVAMLLALLKLPALEHVALFAAGVEPDNTASVRCLRAAGFGPLDPTPDWEGFVYYARRRI